MNEFAYSKRMISPCLRGRPPLTKQSLKATRLKILGLTSMAEANQPQYTWISDGAQSDMHVFTICTMYCGMPEKPTWPWNMLTSLFVHTWSAITPPAPPTKPIIIILAPLVHHPLFGWILSTCDFSFLLHLFLLHLCIPFWMISIHYWLSQHLSDQPLMTLQNPQEALCGWMPGAAAGWPGRSEDKEEEEEEEEPQGVFFCGEQ